MSEQGLQRRIIEALRQRGAYVVNQTAADAGVPDLLVCLPGGRFAAFEVKLPRRYPTRLQRHHLAQIDQAGGLSAVVRSVDEALELL